VSDDARITRRRLIGSGAAAAAGATVAGVPGAAAKRRHKKNRKRRDRDVAVVGAGLAGLTAAREVMRAGHSVIVLEARDRVGGRALNQQIPGGDISERGATFAGPTQDHILDLASELGIDRFLTYNEGENVYYADGSRMTYSDQSPLGTAPPDPLLIPEITATVLRLDQMATEVPVDAPWTAANAAEWDGQTLERWIRDNSSTERFYRIVQTATRPIFGAEPSELSLLFTLFYIAASGNEQNPGTFERNFNTRDGAQMFRFVGGAQRIANELAKQLHRRVVLRSPVSHIIQRDEEVRVRSKRVNVRAKRVIVAIPPTLAARIEYRPGLPPERDQLTQRFPQGNLIKATAVYEHPFWRDAGLTGQVVSLNGPVNVTFDDTPPSGSPGVIFGFVGGDESRGFATMADADRRAAVLKNYVDYFGPAAASPIDYFETHWVEEEWTRGCPVGIMGPGVLLPYGPAIREPVRRIHWAGTETSTYWMGYMDGAVRSGKRAAQEVLAEL
jgi:monoamine oxidase